jgi:hypothetical protein
VSLTIVKDAFGRATVTAPPGAVFVWSKSKGGTFVSLPNNTQEITDNRPTAKWTESVIDGFSGATINFTGTAIAVYGQVRPGMVVSVQVDGGAIKTITVDPATVYKTGSSIPTDQMFWGTSGLSNAAHTVVITSTDDGSWSTPYDEEFGDYLVKRCKVADFFASYTDTITYKCVVDGVTHTATLDPSPDRKEATSSVIAKLLPAMANYPTNYHGNADDPIEDIAAFAGMYYMASSVEHRAAIKAAAQAAYDNYINLANGTTGYVTGGDNERIGYCYYFAWSIFKTDYPTFAADLKAVVEKVTGTYTGTAIPAIDYVNTASNHITPYAYVLALLYLDSSFASYHSNSTILTTITTIMNSVQAAGMIDTDGSMRYMLDIPEDEASYALFTYQHIKFIADKLNIQTANVALATTWLAAQFPVSEPYFYWSSFWNGIQPVSVFQRVQAYYSKNSSIPSGFVDMLYSSAFDMSNYMTIDPNYALEGFAASASITSNTVTIGPQNVSFFYALHGPILNEDVPSATWAWTGVGSVTAVIPANVTSASSIDNVALILTHGELSIEAVSSPTTIDTFAIARQGGEFTIDGSSAASSMDSVEIVQSYGVLAIADCAAASFIATPVITLSASGSGIRSPSGTSYTPRSITGEQLTIRRYSNGAWT